MGFDSGAGQINYPLQYIIGQISRFKPVDLGEAVRLYHWAYGKYLHWSVFPIYGLCFYFLSKYYADKLDVHGTQNFCYSLGFTLFSIGIFEYFWMASFYIFQDQPWILTFSWPQSRLLLQNFGLTFVGIWCILQIHFEEPYKFVSTSFLFNLAGFIAVFFCALWIFYPWSVTSLTVETTTGLWSNNFRFPQTVYTVDLDPLDSVNAGTQFYIENNLIHLVNILAKVFVTLTVMFFGCIIKKEEKERYAREP